MTFRYLWTGSLFRHDRLREMLDLQQNICLLFMFLCLWISLAWLAIAIFNPLNAELNPICHLLALLGAHHIVHVSRIRVKLDIPLCYLDDKRLKYLQHKISQIVISARERNVSLFVPLFCQNLNTTVQWSCVVWRKDSITSVRGVLTESVSCIFNSKLNDIYSLISLACAECDDSLPFSGASFILLCYVLFYATLLH
jgi:hypothetical protein